jgi:prepilin-type N-terminal cleavage/methylation domain-containing protein
VAKIPVSRRGFTLIEMLVVLAIIAMLFALVGVIALKAREKARVSRTKGLLKRIQLGLDEYFVVWREYPSGAPTHPETWPAPYNMGGVEFDQTFVTKRDPGGTSFNKDDMDPADNTYLMDAWGKRIRYRKESVTKVLVWSVGPDGLDDIGDPIKNPGSSERAGDDISSTASDY